ncbi:site-specific integrase [Phycicoccus jejuensis]|uniref:site-specific integrase n=1 Tax=Phycicoccus jejuensis TaxID=367299 RepID=UPI0038510681
MSRRANGEGSIYPYRNGFAAHVWIVTPKGRRQRKTVYGKTRPEVHDKWLRLHEQARRGPMVPVSPRLRDFLERWLEETVRPTLSPATTSNYEMFSRLYIIPDLGDRKLDKLMVRDVQTWVNGLRKRCQCCFQGKDAARPEPQCCALGSCCHDVASDWTVHQAWRVLRGALTQAMREELVFRNVAALVRVPMPRPKKQAVWTVDEARRFLESARTDHDPMYAGYVLLLTLGLRRGELLGLAWEDVDLEKGEALIAWQVQRVEHSLQRRHTKTPSSDAPLPLPQIAVRALERHRVEETRRRLAPATCGATAAWSSPLGSAIRSTRATSTGTSNSGPRRPACPSSPFTPRGGLAPACLWPSMCTRGSRWPSSGTTGSRSPWRSIRKFLQPPLEMPSSGLGANSLALSGASHTFVRRMVHSYRAYSTSYR